MVNFAESTFAAFFALIGVVTALECFTCDWNSKNGTVDNNCLGAPYKTKTKECQTSDNAGTRFVCQTNAVFDVTGGEMHLKTLQRKCGLKHSKCNNVCSDGSRDCWLCCNDNDKCNGFPLRTNIVTVSSAAGKGMFLDKCVLFTSVLIVYLHL